jgi:putative NADPH-quinone reductase
VKILLIVCHPNTGSFNHSVALQARQTLEDLGHEVALHDLYAEGFNPVLPAPELARRFSFDPVVQLHSSELGGADGLLIFHPDWWGEPPAMLKGWIDRVLRPGIAYEYEGEEFLEKKKIPLLGGKKGIVFCTTNERDDAGEAGGVEILKKLWTRRILGYCGMDASCHVLNDTFHSDGHKRGAWVSFVKSILSESFPREGAVQRPELSAASTSGKT